MPHTQRKLCTVGRQVRKQVNLDLFSGLACALQTSVNQVSALLLSLGREKRGLGSLTVLLRLRADAHKNSNSENTTRWHTTPSQNRASKGGGWAAGPAKHGDKDASRGRRSASGVKGATPTCPNCSGDCLSHTHTHTCVAELLRERGERERPTAAERHGYCVALACGASRTPSLALRVAVYSRQQCAAQASPREFKHVSLGH
jgi:hypothetical protein